MCKSISAINLYLKRDKKIWSLRELILLIIFIWLLLGYALFYIPEHGTFGDMFGAVNALFSGLAFVALIYTIYIQTEELKLQREELKLQRDELSSTRKEIKGQREQLTIQNNVLSIQNFENSFFQLLKLLNEITGSVTFHHHGQTYKGKQAFLMLYGTVKDCRYKFIQDGKTVGLTKNEVAEKCSNQIFIKCQSDFGHYFRTLYNIIKFVKDSKVINKKFYTNLVRAQLSTPEVLVIFYDCISELGSEKFKPLIEEFSLLKVIKRDMLIAEHDYSMFKKTAYE